MLRLDDTMQRKVKEQLARPSTQRVLVAGPLALIAAVSVLAAMPHWLPAGPGRIDNLVFPVIAFPLIWAIMFFYACLAADPLYAGRNLGIVTVLQVAIITIALLIR